MSAAIALLARIGELLDRRHIGLYCAILFPAELAMAAFFVAGTYGLIVPLDQPTSTDFVSFYAAGSLVDAGTPALVYDRAAHFAAEQGATAPGILYNYFYYPPVFLLLCAGLARLPYLAAFYAFETATLALYLFVASAILGERRWTSLIALVAFPPLLWNFGYGQNAFLTASLFGAGMLLIERRPAIAGLLLGCLCYKPHFGLLIPVALAAGRHWRAFGGAALSVAALVALSVLLFGAETWHQYFNAAIASPAVYEGHVKTAGFVTPFGAVLMLGGAPRLAYAIQGLAFLAAVSLVGLIWGRDLSLPIRAAALASATLVAVPIALFYDLLLAAIAALWLIRSGGLTPAGRTVMAGLFLACLDPASVFERLGVPVGPLAALGLVGLVVACAWSEATRAKGSGSEYAEGRLEAARRS